ncbi:dihydropteroate synthase [Brevibacterium ihuae]|uniref:dihydropteroate synthase n=1 Tax=Brevibacterium ihuae TaxID=1631743 RepID=UPI000C78FF12|nr:dihydropteroate synthase [Brevibacterium ihuae]
MRTKIMGVLNVTADSFSDGGHWLDFDAAVSHGIDLLEAGADIIDIGGESTRPGSVRVPVDEEMARVVPVTRELARQGAVISVDTMRAEVARAALDAGAHIINDVSAGQAEPEMLAVAAQTGAPVILMHWRGLLTDAHAEYTYDDVVAEVRTELSARIDAALAAGVAEADIILDPGLGFSKDAEHNWQLMAGLDTLVDMGFRLLVAGSRKRFLASLLDPQDPSRVTNEDRDAATAALSAMAARAGAWAVRVHDPRTSRIAVQVAEAIADHASTAPPLPLPEDP